MDILISKQHSGHPLTIKAIRKSIQANKKRSPCPRFCPVALGKSLHCFLEMPYIFITTNFVIHNSQFIIKFRHPQKTSSKKECEISLRDENQCYLKFGFFIPPQNFTPFPKTYIFQFNSQKHNPIPILI